MINITNNAQKEIVATLKKHDKKAVLFGVEPGGCAGLSYGIEFFEGEITDEFDKILLINEEEESDGDYFMVIPKELAEMIKGTEVDYVEGVMNSGFTFNNPNATGCCGCGDSFCV